MFSRRLIVIAAFSVAGAVLMGVLMPGLLDLMFQQLTPGTSDRFEASSRAYLFPAIALLGFIIGGAFGNLMIRCWLAITRSWERMELGDKVSLFLGIFAGIVGSIPFILVFQVSRMGNVAISLITLGLTIGFSALAVLALRSMSEILPWQRGSVRRRKTGVKVLDTNIIIDGRVYELLRAGFLEGEVYVPGFVLEELQHIADSGDPLRRQRGRRGLEILRIMQKEYTVEVGTHDKWAGDPSLAVDTRLVRVAKAIGGDLVTNDFNLNRVAELQDVRVLNINDVALALRPNVLPGESLDVNVIREGSQAGQGVGYLDDGTMVVVEGGKAHLGEHLKIGVTQVIQTERGKLIFGDVLSQVPEPYRRSRGAAND